MDLSDGAERELALTPDGRRLSFVIEWKDPPVLGPRMPLESRSERREALLAAMNAIKQPLLSTLAGFPFVEVLDLAGTGQAVVKAPAERWRTLVESPSLKAAGVRILPNEEFYSD